MLVNGKHYIPIFEICLYFFFRVTQPDDLLKEKSERSERYDHTVLRNNETNLPCVCVNVWSLQQPNAQPDFDKNVCFGRIILGEFFNEQYCLNVNKQIGYRTYISEKYMF